ncbi:AfsR/SARP family transcriptional regulator [Nonomuraea fuscirosea]|uniref:AfsR/SARP family transcriptional regulator n=1 Tax=Nonomuraea fuscirosea TaxID=1291556 RepID=UPI0011B27AFC|nr:AfsR/SARP family transcriptional regulator [Nonomuraea fuscirosea]
MDPTVDHGSPRAAGLTIGLLGPVTGALDGAAIDAGPPLQQAIMAMLAVRAGRVVTLAQLIEGVWGDSPPPSAAQSVYTYIAGLRRAFEPGRGRREPPGVLARTAGGYRLNLDPGRIDTHVFAGRADAAARAAKAGDLDEAVRGLDEALPLWRGRPLSGVPGPFADDERARLEELRLTAVEARADALLRLGRPRDCLAQLQDLSRGHPLRERPRELLMLALHGCGRQAEALTLFEQTRRVLSEELGVDPGEGLRLAHRVVLSGTGGPAVPDPLIPRQLPRDLLAFVGRSREIVRLRSLLDPWDEAPPHPFVVICGPPGVGKSALAVHVAHAVRDRFPEGQLYVNLRGGTPNVARLSSHEIFSRLLRGIGTPDDAVPVDEDEAAALWRSRLQGRRLLVLLDNAADLGQVRPFVSAPLGTAVLVTSRESLVAGDDCVQLRLGPLSDAEATAMLSKLVGADRVSADLGQTTRLARLCDGFPLALRIAGARLADRPDWTVGALTARLTDERQRLRELEAGELAVRSSLAASWGALNGSSREIDGDAARLLGLLGLLHVPDITVEAATALSGSPSYQVERGLERLCDAHLLEATEPGRYRIHDLVRLFAGALMEADERVRPLRRAIGYYAASARAAAVTSQPHRVHCAYPEVVERGRRFGGPEEAHDWLRKEEPILLAAAFQAMADQDDDIARAGTAIGFALWWYQQRAYRVADLVALGERLLATGRRLDDPVITMEGHAHLATGLYLRGDRSVFQHGERHLGLARQLGDRFNEQRAHGNLASTHVKWEQYDDALEHALAQRAIASDMGSRVGELYALLTIGRVSIDLGRFDEALRALDEGAEMARRAGDGLRLVEFALARGRALIELGELATALSVLTDASGPARVSKMTEVGCLVYLARAHRLLGQGREAMRRGSEAVALAESMGSAYWLERAVKEREAAGPARDSIST